MLAIRLQRTGRKGHAQYRVVVQDSHRSPTSGRVVAYLGSYDPHAKTVTLKTEQAQKFLDNGAQPSDRVAGLLKREGVKLPKWVQVNDPRERATRNPEKLRKNQPAAPVEETKEEPAAETKEENEEVVAPATDESATDEVAETPAPETKEEAKEESAESEAPAAEEKPA